MDEHSLELMNPWWRNKEFELGIRRDKYVNDLLKLLKNKEIILLTGLRRVGKTTILRQLITELLKENTPSKILYITMDFISFKGKTLHEIIQKFREIHNHKEDDKIYVFIDEISYSENFEQELKNFYDLENIKIFASSSSASVLKSKNSFLVGRSRIIEISPLNFEEFLIFRNFDKNSPKYLYKKQFEDYLKTGGMPEYVLTGDISYIKNTIEQIIFKDIVAYHNIKDGHIIEKLFVLLCERVGKKLTYSKLAKILNISVDSIIRYVEFFKETFLFYTVDRYARSLNERTHSPKKLYIADNGIRTVFVGFKDKGSLVENLVFLEIKNMNVFYFYDGGKEIDFIVDMFKEKIAIEVKFNENVDESQLKFFNESKFAKKILIKNWEDIVKLRSLVWQVK